jgi:aryl-alcohol dehydrogenase-like predicted oxidoreductase
MEKRRLGSGPEVSQIGLGCMGMSDLYGPADEAESLATIAAALEAGVTLLDTGDFYGMGHNEMLIRRGVAGRDRASFLLSVKFGGTRDPAGAWTGFDARPGAVKNFLAYSLRRLGTDYVDIYRPARLDPNVPIEETAGAIGDMIDAGYVRYFGLSEVGARTLRRAHAVRPVCDVQIEYSLFSRSIEDRLLPATRELGVGVTAYGVLSRGLLSGHWSKERPMTGRDFRAHSPRFSSENVDRNLALVGALRGVADGMGATVAQVAIAWVLSRGDDIVPLIGARTRERLEEALAATRITLEPDQVARIEASIPPGAVAGERYNEQGMQTLDSERG